jgi:archaemetzincin
VGEREKGETGKGNPVRSCPGGRSCLLSPFPLFPVFLTVTLTLATCNTSEGAEGLKGRWAAWQKYAKTYKALELFPPMRYPRGSDWLACHNESGRTYGRYIRCSPVRLTKKRNRIVLQPVGKFTAKQTKMLEAMREHLAIYYQCKVDMFKPVALPKKGFRKRPTGPQYLTKSIMDGILLKKVPNDAAVYMGVTCADIYPGPGWNFVFGQAYLRRRVGIQSLARYYPSFWGHKAPADEDKVVLVRALKTMTHEVGHTFSLYHCVYFQCNINGSNSLSEGDGRHIHLCPVCLKKMKWNRRFDVKRRYEELLKFYKKHGLKDEVAWITKRLKELK